METYRIRIDASAERDLAETLGYISDTLHAPDAAERLFRSIREKSDTLKSFPFRYPVIRDIFPGKREIRRIPVENYLLFYTIDEDAHTVHILRILYARRDWAHLI